jgi:elongation factor P
MLSAGEIRNGVTVEVEGDIYTVIEFQHVKPGKGAAFVRVKLKNLKTGGQVERTFRPTEKMNRARIDRKDMQYLYKDDDFYYFMDSESYDQISLTKEDVGQTLDFVKENEVVKILSHEGNVFGIEPPINVELKVVSAPPAVKGNTATGAVKLVTLETGAKINAPLFVNEGDVVRIDTRTGEYVGRA